jgi:hypothetical protein
MEKPLEDLERASRTLNRFQVFIPKWLHARDSQHHFARRGHLSRSDLALLKLLLRICRAERRRQEPARELILTPQARDTVIISHAFDDDF